jgi:hypothetical protein
LPIAAVWILLIQNEAGRTSTLNNILLLHNVSGYGFKTASLLVSGVRPKVGDKVGSSQRGLTIIFLLLSRISITSWALAKLTLFNLSIPACVPVSMIN